MDWLPVLPIAETRSFRLGDFIVQQRPMQGNPAMPVFVVWLGEKLIGRLASWPTLDDCRWLMRGRYAASSAPLSPYDPHSGSANTWMFRKRGRPTKAEAARRAAAQREPEIAEDFE